MDTVFAIAIVAGLSLILVVTLIVLARPKPGDSSEPGLAPQQLASALTPESLVQRFGRPAFHPDCVPGDQGRSHFGGRPWLAEGEAWPACGTCSKPMPLVMQLDLDAMPSGAPAQRSGGLAQVFFCTNQADGCAHAARSSGPFSRAVLTRVVDPGAGGGRAAENLAPSSQSSQTIRAWEDLEDLPSRGELRDRGVVLTEEVQAFLGAGKHPLGGDKLGGLSLIHI